MTRTEYLAARDQLVMLGALIADIDLPAMRTAISEAESFGPILDPTLYRNAASNLQELTELVDAALPFRSKVLEIRSRVPAAGGAS